MRIAIIGAGNVGSALSTAFGRAGHRVVLASRSVGPSPADAAKQADLVVLAVPFATAGEDVCRQIAGDVAGKVVVDAMNPLNETYSDLVTAGGPSGGERVQAWLPEASVVKAFNTVFAANLAGPHGQPIDGFIAADDQSAADTVLALEAEAGFRPVYVGALARARELEAMAFLNISLQASLGGNWRSAWKLEEPPASAVRAAVDRLLPQPETQPRGV